MGKPPGPRTARKAVNMAANPHRHSEVLFDAGPLLYRCVTAAKCMQCSHRQDTSCPHRTGSFAKPRVACHRSTCTEGGNHDQAEGRWRWHGLKRVVMTSPEHACSDTCRSRNCHDNLPSTSNLLEARQGLMSCMTSRSRVSSASPKLYPKLTQKADASVAKDLKTLLSRLPLS